MIPCWGNRPVVGRCPEEPTRFFVSRVVETPGANPTHNATCEVCYERHGFAHFIKVGAIREASKLEWLEYKRGDLDARAGHPAAALVGPYFEAYQAVPRYKCAWTCLLCDKSIPAGMLCCSV